MHAGAAGRMERKGSGRQPRGRRRLEEVEGKGDEGEERKKLWKGLSHLPNERPDAGRGKRGDDSERNDARGGEEEKKEKHTTTGRKSCRGWRCRGGGCRWEERRRGGEEEDLTRDGDEALGERDSSRKEVLGRTKENWPGGLEERMRGVGVGGN